MKTYIKISGQINGNYKLLGKLHNYNERKDGRFNAFYLYYNTIREAKNDIKKAYRSFKDEYYPDMTSISKTKDNRVLYFDASTAIIYDPKV